MDKKGFMRILEATIAILIIISVLFLFFNQQREPVQIDRSENARDLLEEAAQNKSLRELILDDPVDISLLENFIDDRLPDSLGFEVKICDVTAVCGIDFIEGNVYSAERVISTTIDRDALAPKKVRLFIWEKQV